VKRIQITVTPTGETKIETLGFIGRTCKLASAFLERALGRVTDDQPTTQVEESNVNRNSSRSDL
jgi:hypothetical protein